MTAIKIFTIYGSKLMLKLSDLFNETDLTLTKEDLKNKINSKSGYISKV